MDASPHPGAAPNILIGATQHQIAEANRTYAAVIAELSILGQVQANLQQMILKAVEKINLVELEDKDFGFAEVSIIDMLNHLVDWYTTVTREELKQNQEMLKCAWNPDCPIEELWLQICNAKALASARNEAISNWTAMELVIKLF